MTTETIATFDIPKARQDLAEMENELSNARDGLAIAVANSDMEQVLKLVPVVNELPLKIEKLAKKIARESGEEVLTRKAEVSAQFKVWIAENVLRNPDFVSMLSELKTVNPKLKSINIDFEGDATQPGAINLVGGYRKTDPAKKGTTKRPRAKYWTESFGNDEEGNPRTMSTKDVIIAYAGKYWTAVFGPESTPQAYDSIKANDRTKLASHIVQAEGLQNLAAAS